LYCNSLPIDAIEPEQHLLHFCFEFIAPVHYDVLGITILATGTLEKAQVPSLMLRSSNLTEKSDILMGEQSVSTSTQKHFA